MTCIVALKHKSGVIMGADSAGIEAEGSLSLRIRKDPKIFRVGNQMLIGFTSSFRMGQLLGYNLKMPAFQQGMCVDEYMNTKFIDAVREVMTKGGYMKKEEEREEGGNFLAAFKGRIFSIDTDFQVGESRDSFDAVGCGAQIAVGSLYSTAQLDARQRVNLALKAAERYSGGVRGPFLINTIGIAKGALDGQTYQKHGE